MSLLLDDLDDRQQEFLLAITQTMPFGKYKGSKLIDLPEPYLVWFHARGFPKGKLGEQLALMYEVKLNGLEGMLRKLVPPDRQAVERQ